MLFVKNALKSKDNFKKTKAIIYYDKWKQSKPGNYFYNLPDNIINLINTMSLKLDPLCSYESAKHLSTDELHKLSINEKEKGIEVNMDELQVGDYIETYNSYKFTIKRISRKTNKCIFVKELLTDDNYNFISTAPETMGGSIYSYYYVNIHTENHLSSNETKILIKSEKIKKAIDNFIIITEFDMGH